MNEPTHVNDCLSLGQECRLYYGMFNSNEIHSKVSLGGEVCIWIRVQL